MPPRCWERAPSTTSDSAFQRYSRQDRSCYVSGPAHVIGTGLNVPCVDGSGLARGIVTSQAWSVQPCVRPVCAVHMTAGHNALRGSGPGQKPAFENAVAHMGCPDRRLDRLCITCCSPSATLYGANTVKLDLRSFPSFCST